MASKAKKSSQKVLGKSAVDVQYVNDGNLENISWASILNVEPGINPEYPREYPPSLKKDRPTSALLSVDCENVSKAHLPLMTTKVADDIDNVELEMTVTSEFTLVGYQDEDDDCIPDEETLKDYADTSESLSRSRVGRKGGKMSAASVEKGRSKGKSLVTGIKREKDDSSPTSGSPRGRPRRRHQNDTTDKDWSDTEVSSIVMKNKKVTVKKECPYKCEECSRSFPTAAGLKIHAMIHTESGNFVCFVCGNAFASLRQLKSHVSTHTSESQNICDECCRWFKDQKVLKRHVARHGNSDAGEKVVDCGVCGDEFETVPDLAEHVLGHVSEMKSNACLVCGRHLAPMSSMEKHLRTHTGEKMATCPVCSRKFAEAYNLKSHMRIHTGERPYSCPQCKRRFTSVSTLKNHILTHSSEKHYACTYCEKRFRRSSHLVEHRRSHTGERPYACMHCGKRYTTSTAMRSHLVSHTRENRFSCPVCDFATPRAPSLRKHLRTHEDRPADSEAETERRYMCADCGRQFSRMKNMEKHIEMHRRRREQGLDDFAVETNVRTMEKLYSCLKCDRKFARYRNLQKHCFVHGDADADLAGKPFRHIGDKPYICAECGRPFARIGNMQKHFLTHWEEGESLSA